MRLNCPHRSDVLVQDEVVWLPGATQNELRWQLTTDAEISVDGDTAVLSKAGRSLQARVLVPSRVVFQVVSAVAGPSEQRNPGVSQLIAIIHNAAPETRVAVLLSFAPTETNVVPIANW